MSASRHDDSLQEIRRGLSWRKNLDKVFVVVGPA